MQNHLKLVIAAIALVFAPIVAKAQDIITKTDETTISARVIEIGETTITYRAWDNLEGPVYKVSRSTVSKITFENGKIEYFSAQPKYEQPATAPVVNTSPIVNASPVTSQGVLTYSRGDFSLNGEKISAEQVRRLIGEDIYTSTYESAVKQRKLGNALTMAGAITTGAGVGLFCVGLFGSALFVTDTFYYDPENPSHTWGHTYSYDDNLDKTRPYIIAGSALMSAGLLILGGGITFSTIGNKRLDWIATDYNQKNRNYSYLNFGPTKNGVGLYVRF